jgi:hypothetical protein
VETAVDEEVTLRSDAGDMYLLPDFQEKNFVVVNEHELLRSSGAHTSVPSLYWYPSAIGPSDFAYPGSSGPAYLEQVKENIPQGTVALKEGAKVISADDKHVGNVEQVLTSPETDLATYFVISKGLLLKERKLVPTFWVSRLDEENVYLAVGSHLLDELRPYSEKSQPEMA